MADDYGLYHSLGQPAQFDPAADPNRRYVDAPATHSPYAPPVPPPGPQQHQQQFYAGNASGHPPPPPPGAGGYGVPTPSVAAPGAGQDYFHGQSQHLPPGSAGPAAGDLAAQMGGLNIADPAAAAGYGGTARRKKKDRHAYHAVEASAGGGGFGGGMLPSPGPPQPLGSTTPFGAAVDAGGGGQFLSQPSPQMLGGPGGQFPAPVNAPYNPVHAASAAEFATRNGAAVDTVASMVPGGVGQQRPGGGVSPDDMPSVPVSRDVPQQFYLRHLYPTFQRHVPPPAAVSFVALDQGNASPKFARLTMNCIPATAEGLHSTGLPLGLLVQPLAPLSLQGGEAPVPVLDFGEQGPPRCRRCRAYVNPFMMFRSGGGKFVCNLCTYPNDTPPEYFSPTSPQGVRVDRDQRPELTRGTVEFVVPKEYWTKEPVPIRWLFLIDVTQESINKGFLEAFCEGILSALYSEKDGGDADEGAEDADKARRIPKGAKVGFVTFDKDIHFYNVNPALEQAQMMIMPDIEDPFVPLSEGLFVDPYESKTIITSLLTRLPSMFSSIKNPEPALLPTLTAALAALEKTGGKIVCSLSALPTWGPNRLFLRDDGKHPGGEVDKKLFTTEHPAWRKAAEKFVTAGVGIDFFMAAPSGGFLDIATVGHVAATSGGETFYYPNFIAGRDNRKLSLEIRHSVTRETGCQALMKVRCSNGLQISAYHGNFIQHTFGADLEMGAVDADKAIAVTFSYDGKLDSKLDAHFQSALLYTTASGERRVRCSNVIASVSDHPKECMKFVDQDAVYVVLAKEAATRLANTGASLKDVRLGLTERTIDVLAGYRKNFSSQAHPPGQLVMPEKLKEFSMYMLGLVKSRAFKGGSESTDRRVHEMRMLRCMGALETSLYLYPRMIALHNLQPEEGFPETSPPPPENGGDPTTALPATGHLKMPPMMRTSFARVEPGGVYLVDNGQQVLLWMHAQTSPNLLADLFGPGFDSLQALDAYTSALPVLQTHLNCQARNILEFLAELRGSKAVTVQLARQGIDGAEYEFARMLVEDRNNEAQSYVDWLVNIHKGVQLELAGQRKREDGGDATSLAANFAGLRPNYW